ncbi:AP-2 complex subunit beta-like, partial [Sagmatias obliquidens]|uniref:AP-2 complex subunit beta-like n=1 Tax=Sagmatias obliquidens TaxID=3371155 RepID=UPI000F4457AB
MTDSKYFTTNKKGEVFELKAELNSEKKEKKKEAVKKVIAAMTVGKDVSCLFPDVVNCMQTDNLELKKLVYLYLMNYAKSQPDMAIMAVNSFVKVTFSQGLKNGLFYLRKPFQKCLLIWLVSALQISNLCSKRGPLEKYWPLSRNIHDLSILYARVCLPVQTI